jgi:hypothetical protein
MQVFILGIITSLFGTIIFAGGIYLFSNKFRKMIVSIILKLINIGIVNVYSSLKEAQKDICNSFRKSSNAKILTLRGRSFLSDQGELTCLLNTVATNRQKIEFIFSDPRATQSTNFAKVRADEVFKIDGQDPEHFLKEVQLDIDSLVKMSSSKPVSIRIANFPITHRLIIFDDDMYLFFYDQHNRAVNNRVFCIASSSELYKSYLNYFNLISKHLSKKP